jgi:recombinase
VSVEDQQPDGEPETGHSRVGRAADPMTVACWVPAVVWVEPTYHAVHNVLTHPAYAGAYVFGKTRQRRHLGEDGVLRTSRRKLPQGEWEVLIRAHHRGFID